MWDEGLRATEEGEGGYDRGCPHLFSLVGLGKEEGGKKGRRSGLLLCPVHTCVCVCGEDKGGEDVGDERDRLRLP